MEIIHIDRFVELLSHAFGVGKRTIKAEAAASIVSAFSTVFDGPTRMSFLSAASVYACVPELLPFLISWRADPAVRRRIRALAERYSGLERLELLIFVAEPEDPALETLFCEALQQHWSRETESIQKYVAESCGGDRAHFDEEVAGVHLRLFPYLIRFAAFGYVRQFKTIPRIPEAIGPGVAQYQRFIEPILRGSETVRIALESLLPQHVLPEPAPERSREADAPLSLAFPDAETAATPTEPSATTVEPDLAYKRLMDSLNTSDRRAALAALGREILRPEFRDVLPILLRGEDRMLAEQAAEIYLSAYAEAHGHVPAMNHAVELSFQVPQLEVFTPMLVRLLETHGRRC